MFLVVTVDCLAVPWTDSVSQVCPEAQAQAFGSVQVCLSDCEDWAIWRCEERFPEEEGEGAGASELPQRGNTGVFT